MSTDSNEGTISRRDMIGKLTAAGCTACMGSILAGCPGGSTWGKEKHDSDVMASMDIIEFDASSVPLNSAMKITVAGSDAWLVHFEEEGAEQWLALEDKCTHKKSSLNFREDESYFKCPLHKSEFNIDGSLRARDGGKKWPARRALKAWSAEVKGSKVLVDPKAILEV